MSCSVFLFCWSQCWTPCRWLKLASISLSPACPVEVTFLITLAALCCLLPPTVLAQCPGIPHTKQFPFLGPLLKSRFFASATETLCLLCLCAVLMEYLQPFPQICEVRCCSVKIVEAFCNSKLKYINDKLLRTKALKRVSETASPASCSLVSNSCPLTKNYPNSHNPRAAVEPAVPPKSPLSASPHIEIFLAKAFKPLLHLRCGHLPHSHISSAWRLLHLESLPDGTAHCSVSPWCLQLPSHLPPSASCSSSSHHCSPLV